MIAICAWLELDDTKSFIYCNGAVKEKAWKKIWKIFTASAFCTNPLPIVGGGHVIVSGSDSSV